MPTRGVCHQRTVGPLAGTYPTSQAASRWASRWNPLSVELCLRPLLAGVGLCSGTFHRSRLMQSIMMASLSGLTISHLCLSALPRATKEVPTTAQTALRRHGSDCGLGTRGCDLQHDSQLARGSP